MASQKFFHFRIDLKTKKEISSRPFAVSSTLKDKYSKKSRVCFLKQRDKQMLQVCLIYQSNQYKMNSSTRVGNVSMNEKAKITI